MKRQFISPAPTKIPIPKSIGESKQAPGLKIRQQDILHKALGIDQGQKIHPANLQKLVGHHDPAIAAAAKKALGMPVVSKGFDLKGPKAF